MEGDGIELVLVAHVLDLAHELDIRDAGELLAGDVLRRHRAMITSLLAARTRLMLDGAAMQVGSWSEPEVLPARDALRVRGRLPLPAGRIPGRVAMAGPVFPYDPIHQTFVNIYEHGSLVKQAILSARRAEVEHFTGTRQGRLAVVRRFGASGVHHILIGPDHLLFLVGLLLAGGRLRRLVLVVSAFTVAHSITLSLAVLGVVSPPAWVVEPAIALSIVYVGADNLLVERLRPERGAESPRDVRAWIAFAFGLIHGFGFAGVLREMELPAGALGWSLLSFNLGVEAGQVLVVIPVAAVLWTIRGRSEVAGQRVATLGSVAVIAAGVFWFLERTFT